ncbi:hypothetical protein TRFO_19973 [Tritrichomonas foetus]|uniref:Uncharacterized protein n=1 Tax=Tritrichomonas foetus TaxID=1144522 RepID=A0A1J4KH45_9EUKA|nr:hypothetical protein TRFO_19973 [Tritrichomonas foetus]|eukprot:OHT10735.1 hypothetical protein TRFO_19973 [Tritrichomonas foetus]
MNYEKPHRLNSALVDPDQEDPFDDRRLSDLLPTEFIRQIGFDPQAFLFNNTSFQMRRRMTDPGLFVVYNAAETQTQRRMTTIEKYPTPPPPNIGTSPLCDVTPQQITNWFLVELSDVKVNAFSTFHTESAISDGVVVRDGVYLRFGRILKEIKAPQTFDRAAPQIISIDITSSLSDYIIGQTAVASAMIPTFLRKCDVPCEFISLETVSYDARALFRVKVTNASAPHLDRFVRLLIQTFCVAVEVYD